MLEIEEKIHKIIKNIFKDDIPDKIAIGVSGGADSMALIFLLKEILTKRSVKLFALIVNHKARTGSKNETEKTAKTLEKHDISCQILESYLENSPNSNIESGLREVRYNLLSNFCQNNNIKYLFIAHHAQDQAENFLIRLFRGSGIDGLAATDYISKFKNITIIRPLLDFKKEELTDYLTQNNISWIEDESNKDEKFLRNKIRNFLNTLEDKDLINQRINLATNSILQNKKIIDNNLAEISKKIAKFNEMGYVILNKEEFTKMNPELGKKYLTWCLMEISGNYYKPRFKYLENLYFWILNEDNEQKRCFYGTIIQKNKDLDKIIIYREKSAVKDCKLTNNMIWDNRFKIKYLGNDEDIMVTTLNAEQFNRLEITKPNIIIKDILYTIPIFKKNNEILAINQLGFYKDKEIKKIIRIDFDKKTKL